MSEAGVYPDKLPVIFLNNVLNEVMCAVKAECGSLFLFDPQNKELVLNSYYNDDKVRLDGLKQRVGEGVSGKIANIRAPVLVKNIDLDSRFRGNGFNHYRTKSFISIPLFSAENFIGLINVTDKSSCESFSEEDLKVSVSIAKYACLALESLSSLSGLKEEKEILKNQKVLLEKYASVGRLAAGVVHEINNPLDGIVRYTNMLLSQMDEYSVAREYLLEIKKGLGRIAEITRSLVEFSYQVNSSATRPKKYVDLNQLIDECLDFCGEKHDPKVELEKDYASQLPRIHDLGLWHVFRNLIKNSLDAMPEGGRLKISTRTDGEDFRVLVADTGSGIPEELKELVFQPFFTTKPIYKGSGLGLAICKEIIGKYDGQISLESAPGKGTNFIVTIPRKYAINV